MYFHYFVIIPLGKGRGPSFEQTWIPFTQECFVPSLDEIGPVVLEKKMKMWKVYDDNNDDNDGQQLTFGSGELKTQFDIDRNVIKYLVCFRYS